MNADVHSKEVYANLGRAIWQAQALEQGIVHALIFCDLLAKMQKSEIEFSQGELIKTLDEYPKKTLRKLIKALKNTGETLGEDLELKLANSLEVRDWLVHNYGKNRYQHFLSAVGRAEMISELARSDKLFTETDNELEAWLKPIRQRYGYTDEILESSYAQYSAAASS